VLLRLGEMARPLDFEVCSVLISSRVDIQMRVLSVILLAPFLSSKPNNNLQKHAQQRQANMATNLFSQWNNANKRINSPSRDCKFSQIDHRSRHRNRKQKHPFERLQNSFQTDEKSLLLLGLGPFDGK
jgi:hypothetical protein